MFHAPFCKVVMDMRKNGQNPLMLLTDVTEAARMAPPQITRDPIKLVPIKMYRNFAATWPGLRVTKK